jgi:hypothetical protein
MIQYALKCREGHAFDSWFQSAAAFDTLAKAGHLSCAVCGTGEVSKAVMTPRVGHGGGEKAEVAPSTKTAPQNAGAQVEKAIAALRRNVEQNSTYVGRSFAKEARAMHLGDKPTRSIYGEARPEEARSLAEDGVPLLPLPFTPKKKLS